jgi:hypothetical protein
MKKGLVVLVAALLACGGLFVAPLFAQEEPEGDQGSMQGMEKCQMMMQKRQQMIDRFDAWDTELEQLLERMNAAEGQAKVDAMAEVIRAMVEQRREMRETMMAWQPRMMKHMAGHMERRMASAGTRRSMGGRGMMDCPMMQAAEEDDAGLE